MIDAERNCLVLNVASGNIDQIGTNRTLKVTLSWTY